jgi:hypothetical protein
MNVMDYIIAVPIFNTLQNKYLEKRFIWFCLVYECLSLFPPIFALKCYVASIVGGYDVPTRKTNGFD